MNKARFATIAVLILGTGAACAQDTAFSYQGVLNQGNSPATGTYDLRFTIYDSGGGNFLVAGPLTNASVAVVGGQFTVGLDFGPGVFTSAARWLEIAVRTNGSGSFTTLSPRQPITPAPYAIHAAGAETAATAFLADVANSVAANAIDASGLQNGVVTSNKIADGSIALADLSPLVASNTFWRLGGNLGTTISNYLGTTDGQPLELRVNNGRALRLEPGSSGAPNVIGGSERNAVAAGHYGATIAGGGSSTTTNIVTGSFGVVGGGADNSATAYAVVAGGSANATVGIHSAIGGGFLNHISPDVDAYFFGIVPGSSSVIGGGEENEVRSIYSVIGGGTLNLIQTNSGDSFIGGGTMNTISSHAYFSTLVGGWENYIGRGAEFSFVGGGEANEVGTNAFHAVVAGGLENVARGAFATVPGGSQNLAEGRVSFAAGQRARARHEGAFVWADVLGGNFDSMASNQFLIRAAGGVGIGTNNPQAQLHVRGTALADAFRGAFVGDGSGLTNLPNSSVSSNVAFLNSNQTFTAANIFSGVVTANHASNRFAGNGAGLTALDADNLSSGTVPAARLANNVARLNFNQIFTATQNFAPAAGAPFLVGNATKVTSLNADLLDGLDSSAFAATAHAHAATDISNGTLNDARLSGNVALRGATNTFTSTNSFSGLTLITNHPGNQFAGNFRGNGGGLTNLSLGAASVPWANLTGVPAGFADAVDNDTTYSAGLGLGLVGTQFSVNFGGSGGAGTASRSDHTHDATQVVSGALNDARLSANVALRNANNSFGGSNSFAGVVTASAAANVFAGAFFGNGAGLSNVTASAFTGSIADNQLSANIPRLTGGAAFAGAVTATGFNGNGSGLTLLNASQLTNGTVPDGRLAANVARTNQVWLLSGNAGTTPGAQFLGTTDNQALELKANNVRALRLEPNATSPNVLGGFNGNFVSNGVAGAVIAGGGQLNNSNRVGGSFSTVGGGYNNVAYFGSATVAGGDNNRAAQDRATVSGGFSNRATGLLSTVGGGDVNLASGQSATVPGGSLNEAAAAYAFAAGRRAKATNQGAFVWADSQNADFASTSSDQFLIRAAGGVGIGVNNPSTALDVAGTVRATIFSGNGIGVTNLNASQLASGTVPDARLSANVALLNGSQTFTGIKTFGSELLANAGLRLNNSNLWLRSGSDLNHGLGWYGDVKPFAGVSNVIDGPVLFGFAGGALGTERFGPENIALFWNSSGRVGIGLTNPATALHVNGTVTATSFSGNGAGLTNLSAATLGGVAASGFWTLGGNNITSPVTQFLGSSNNQAIEFRVNNARALRLEPNGTSPNVVGGYFGNATGSNAVGATIAGGGKNEEVNQVMANYGAIGGGHGNTVVGLDGTVSGGFRNGASNTAAVVGGGWFNAANGPASTIGGGYFNSATTNFATIGGGATNSAMGRFATVGGGTINLGWGEYATISGGGGNYTPNQFATIAGGNQNLVQGDFGSVAGGFSNEANGPSASVGGGENNTAGGSSATVGGGFNNTASAALATVAGGAQNVASGEDAVVGGGQFNHAGGANSTVPGGAQNSALGQFSFAAGQHAEAGHDGSFVWADSQSPYFGSTGANQFLIRAAAGVGIGRNSPRAPLDVQDRMRVTGVGGAGATTLLDFATYDSTIAPSAQLRVTDVGNFTGDVELRVKSPGADSNPLVTRLYVTSTGNVGLSRTPSSNRLEVEGDASKSTAGSWLANSDARIKTGVQSVTNALEKVERVRLVSFRYSEEYRKAHPGIADREYLNVIAQEFQEVFPEAVRGSGEKLPSGDEILQVDTYPLTIYSAAAIQELNRKLAAETKAQRLEMSALRRQNVELEERVAELERLVRQLVPTTASR